MAQQQGLKEGCNLPLVLKSSLGHQWGHMIIWLRHPELQIQVRKSRAAPFKIDPKARKQSQCGLFPEQ